MSSRLQSKMALFRQLKFAFDQPADTARARFQRDQLVLKAFESDFAEDEVAAILDISRWASTDVCCARSSSVAC